MYVNWHVNTYVYTRIHMAMERGGVGEIKLLGSLDGASQNPAWLE